MRQDYRRSIIGQCLLDHLARIYAGTINGPAKQFAERNDSIPIVQHQAGLIGLALLRVLQRGAQARGVARRDEETVDPVLDELGQCPPARRDDG